MKTRQFTFGRWVLWTFTAAMFFATLMAPSHKFIFPLAQFLAISLYVGYMLARGVKTRPRKLTIEEEWQIEEIRRANAESKN